MVHGRAGCRFDYLRDRVSENAKSSHKYQEGAISVDALQGFDGQPGGHRDLEVRFAAQSCLPSAGVTVLPGVYFAGVDFGSTRKSGIVLAIAEEAPRLADHIVGRSLEAGRAMPALSSGTLI